MSCADGRKKSAISRLVFRIYKELLQLLNKTTNSPIKEMGKRIDIFFDNKHMKR